MALDARLCEIIAEQLEIAEGEIETSSHFFSDLGADSLDMMELVLTVEEEFSVDIDDDEVESIETVGDLARLLGLVGQTN